MKAKIITTILIILALIVLAFLARNGVERKSMVLDKVVIAGIGSGSDLLLYFAQEKGFYKDAGLDVEIRSFEAGRFAGDELVSGNSHFAAMADFGYISLLVNNDNDLNLKVVAGIAETLTHELLARKDRDISEVDNLVGKKIGVTEFTSGHFFLGTFLVRHGLKLDDVEVVFMSPSELVAAITNGEVDAVLTWEPNVYEIKQNLGDKVISWPAQKNQPTDFLLISRQDWLENNSNIAERVLQALLITEEYVASHDEETISYLGQRGGYDENYLEVLRPNYDFFLSLSQNLLSLFEDQNKWNIRNNVGDGGTPNYLDYIYMDGLLKVKPESVTIIR